MTGFGYSFDKALPFNKALEPKRATKSFLKTFDQGVLQKSDEFRKFFHRYTVYFNANVIIRDRYLFFMKILNRDEEVMSQYSTDIGEVALNERVAYALHRCILEGERTLEELHELYHDLPSNYFAEKLDDEQREQSARKAKDESEKFLLECESIKVPDIRPPATDCEITGICSCKNLNEQPYMNSCVDDSAILLRTKKAEEERFTKITKEVCEPMSQLLS